MDELIPNFRRIKMNYAELWRFLEHACILKN